MKTVVSDRSKRILIHLSVIFGVSILIKIIGGLIVNNYKPITWEYELLAQSLLKTGEYKIDYREYGVFYNLLAPGYTFLCYGVYSIIGTNHAVILGIQFLIMTGFAITIYFITYCIFADTETALIAGLLASLHPGLNYYTVAYLHKITLYVPLFFLSILLFCIALRRQKIRYFVAVGFVSGLAVLSRATFVPVFFLSILAYFLMARNSTVRQRLANCVCAILVFLGVNLPWSLRNYCHFERISLLQNNKWESFWVGNNPNASGGHLLNDGSLVLGTKPPDMQEEILENKGREMLIEETFRKYSIAYVSENPIEFISGLVKKGAYFWWFYPHTGAMYPKKYLLAYKLIYVLLLLLTFYGLYLCQRKKLWTSEMLFLAILIFSIWATHTVNFMEMRHRWTIEPVLFVFSALALREVSKLVLSKICSYKV